MSVTLGASEVRHSHVAIAQALGANVVSDDGQRCTRDDVGD